MESLFKIIEFSVGGGFFRFIGCIMIIYLILETFFKTLTLIINRPLRHWNIRKHGYPPPHCDADGDFKQQESQDELE